MYHDSCFSCLRDQTDLITKNVCSSEFTHPTQSNAIHWIMFDIKFGWRTQSNTIWSMDWVRFSSICSIEYDWNSHKLPRSIWFECPTKSNSIHGLSSISECSIDYAASKARGVPVAFHAVISCTFAGHACTHWALTGVLFMLCAHSSPDWNRKLFVTTNKCHCGQTDIVTQVWAPIFSKTCYNGKKYLLTRNHSGAVRILVKPPLKLQSRSF